MPISRQQHRLMLRVLDRCFELGIDRYDAGAKLVADEYRLDDYARDDLERRLDLNRGAEPFSTRPKSTPLKMRGNWLPK